MYMYIFREFREMKISTKIAPVKSLSQVATWVWFSINFVRVNLKQFRNS